LPVVIAAIAALILFKGIGILTNGGYVLTGASPAAASSETAPAGDAAALPTAQDATMTDTSPTLTDGAMTLPLDAKGEDADAPADAAGDGAVDAAGPDGTAGGEGHGAADAGAASAAATACPTGAPAPEPAPAEAAKAGAKEDFSAGFDFVKPPVDCTPSPGVNAEGDALPLEMTGAGTKVPMKSMDPDANSADQLLERLAERRAELDKLAADLDMRQSLVEAAETRLDERTAALKALEAKVEALVKEKETAEQQQFVGIVAMYEAMKPKDAAAIFDQLEMPILLKVTMAMSPRKMAPILAAMSTTKAKDLTASLAADQGQQTIEVGQDDSSELPQIVGQ
jgi:flagellar motility protein MotE (MotC chaperone)